MKKKTGYYYLFSGFTLIELLVVIAILGILATVGLASFRSSQIKGRDASRKHDLGQIQRGLEAYYNDKGEYPDAPLPSPGAEWRDEEVTGGTLYMKAIPADPSGRGYLYESSTISYMIFAYLENQKDKDIRDCIINLGKSCDSATCNYGVSSANVDVCD